MEPVGKDPRWDAFGPFHDYLGDAFPRVSVNFFLVFEYLILMSRRSHESLKLTKVNTYGLFYEWKGSDNTLKPLLLAAHQGVSSRGPLS